MKLSDAITGYFLDKDFQFSPKTKYAYTKRLGFLLGYLGDVEVEGIDKTHVRSFLAEMRTKRNLSDRSVYDYYTTCGSFWAWAKDELGIPHVVREIPRPTYVKKTVNYFDREEVVAILKCLDWTKDYTHRSGVVTKNKRPNRWRDKAALERFRIQDNQITSMAGSLFNAPDLIEYRIDNNYQRVNGEL